MTPPGPPPAATPALVPSSDRCTIIMSGDNYWVAYLNGTKVGEGKEWKQASITADIPLRHGTNTLAVKVSNKEFGAGLLFDVRIGTRRLVSDTATRASRIKQDNWELPGFNDSTWTAACLAREGNGDAKKNSLVIGMPQGTMAKWIWSHSENASAREAAFFRLTFEHPDRNADPIMP